MTLNMRQVRKFAVELVIAVLVYALTYLADNLGVLELSPGLQAAVVLGIQIALQTVRRIGRDTMAGGPPSA
jgi:hypothetical protein